VFLYIRISFVALLSVCKLKTLTSLIWATHTSAKATTIRLHVYLDLTEILLFIKATRSKVLKLWCFTPL